MSTKLLRRRLAPQCPSDHRAEYSPHMLRKLIDVADEKWVSDEKLGFPLDYPCQSEQLPERNGSTSRMKAVTVKVNCPSGMLAARWAEKGVRRT